MAKPTQPINAGSMADIAFLLLIFFLVTTTMDVDTGIARKLPPPIDPEVEPPPPIKDRNVFIVLVNSADQLLVEGKRGDIATLREDTKNFLQNPYNDPNLSDFSVKEIDYLGAVRVSKGVISLQNDRGTSYGMYIQVQNEVAAAVKELRDKLSKKTFGMKFADLKDDAMIKSIKKAIPVSVSEAEPFNVGGQ